MSECVRAWVSEWIRERVGACMRQWVSWVSAWVGDWLTDSLTDWLTDRVIDFIDMNTYMNIGFSWINNSTADMFPKIMFMMMKKKAPTLNTHKRKVHHYLHDGCIPKGLGQNSWIAVWIVCSYCSSYPFTPKNDQIQISPAVSPGILHHTVWRTWLFMANSDENLLRLPKFPGERRECSRPNHGRLDSERAN